MALVFLYRNLVDNAALIGSELPNFPISNLKVRSLAEKWRAEPVATIDVDFGEPKTIRAFGLIDINWLRRPGASGFCTLRWSEDGTTWSAMNVSAGADFSMPELSNRVAAVLPAPVLAQFVQLEMNWETIGEVPWIEASRLMIGDALVIPDGSDAGWELSVRDRGRLEESAGLQAYAAPGKKQRMLRTTLSGLSTAHAYGFDDAGAIGDVPSVQDLINYAGSTGEVLVLQRQLESPAMDAIWARRVGIYGHLTDDSLTIRHVAGPTHSATLTVVEES